MVWNRSLVIGLLAGLASAIIGASWQVATRYGVSSSLLPSDLALLRYVTPAIIFLPLLWRNGILPKGVDFKWLVLLLIGGGFPFGLLAMTGASMAPASHMGVLLAGTMPLFTALLFYALFREKISQRRLIGYAFILLGTLSFGWISSKLNAVPGAWRGDLLFLCASIVWALYTLAYRQLALSPWYVTAVVCFWSAICAVIWVIATGTTQLFVAPVTDVALQIVMQGLVAGLLGLSIYSISIRHLGPDNASIFGALVPLLSTAGGVALLNESVSTGGLCAMLLVVVGIALASRFASAAKV